MGTSFESARPTVVPLFNGGGFGMENFITAQEMADMLRTTPTNIYRKLKARELEHYRVGNRVVIPRESVEKYLDRCRVKVAVGD